MEILFLLFLTILLLHILYNYLALPLLREKLKYQLFALRDKFRRYELENKGKVNSELLEYFKGTINKTINIVEILDMSIIIIIKRALKNDSRLPGIILNYQNLFDKYATDEIRIMEQEKHQIALKIFYLNTIEIALCIMPVCILAKFIGYSFGWIKKLVNDFVNLPEEQVLCHH